VFPFPGRRAAHLAERGSARESPERRLRPDRIHGWKPNREEHVMRMRETWLAISPSKKTIMFSSVAAAISMPPLQRVYNGLLLLKIGARDAAESDDLWFAVSQKNMTPTQ
jgi:hypothetical protein